jgi:hypothetical protein
VMLLIFCDWCFCNVEKKKNSGFEELDLFWAAEKRKNWRPLALISFLS